MDGPSTDIELRGVRVHNLQNVDVNIPTRRLIAVCGVSGSGKTSLALDTLYAEGQRRYIESFSAYSRQFLERIEKPDADRIEGLPPAIAVRVAGSGNRRSTVGTMTEINDHLRLLYARMGEIVCDRCGRTIRAESPQSVADECATSLGADLRWMIAFPVLTDDTNQPIQDWREQGFVRVLLNGKVRRLDEEFDAAVGDRLYVIVDRLKGADEIQRVRDSLETAFELSGGCTLLLDAPLPDTALPDTALPDSSVTRWRDQPISDTHEVDGRPWLQIDASSELRCESCQIEFLDPSPPLFSFNSLGACPTCEGFGNVLDLDWERIVPDKQKSIRQGAIAPWNSPAYIHELHELLEFAAAESVDVDLPFSELPDPARAKVVEGVPGRNFRGLIGLFDWLERRKYQMKYRAFLSRWKSERPCPECQGRRLRPEALAVKINGLNFVELLALTVSCSIDFLADLDSDQTEGDQAASIVSEAGRRLGFLRDIGLDYLSLDRTLRSLSGGELQRVALTKALGSSLVNLLYVLDEPSAGLHAHDIQKLIPAIRGICNRGNTVLMVEHQELLLEQAEQLIEIGPGAGVDGGQIVFQGTYGQMMESSASKTGTYLAGKLLGGWSGNRRKSERGRLKICGARGNNLKNLDVEFPLGLLCVVSGVSGAGKSSLVQQTLHGALLQKLDPEADLEDPLPFDELHGVEHIDDVLAIDQTPIGKTGRSNPVTYIKAFDAIRQLFAATPDAKACGYRVGHFSFNSGDGRCDECEGDGSQRIDMQFLADMVVPCPRCQGSRYRKEILEVKYRTRSIADVLEMTVKDAILFFRGQKKIQAKLQPLADVGLGYLTLGQPASTLSRGEAQRLKLATYLTARLRKRTLFLMDEPSAGLHYSDIVKLLDCFTALLNVGHSLVVVEHNLQMLLAADHLIDLGPGAAGLGGEVVAIGTPEDVSRVKESLTGKAIAEKLKAVG